MGLVPLPGTPTALTIDGDPIDLGKAVIPRRLVAHQRRGIPSLTLSVKGRTLPTGADPYLGKEAVLSINGTVRFVGDVSFVGPEWIEGRGWHRTYQVVGLADRANFFPHTDAIKNVDQSAFNLSADNGGPDYLASRAGRTAGQILEDVLTGQAVAEALDAAGLGGYTSLSPPTLPSATAADLAAMTVIPKTAVYFGGEKLWQSILGFCAQWAPNFDAYVQPDGIMRFRDVRGYSSHTFTLGVDPVFPSGISRDLSECYGRVIVRGEPIAEMAEFRTDVGTLDETPFAHDGLTVAQAKTAFTPYDFTQPGFAPGQATGAASLSGGAVNSGTVVYNGYGYASAPSVVVVGDGSGASYTTSISGGKVTALNKVSGGSGYTKASFVIASPTGASADTGTCSCTSSTTVVVTSSNPGAAWPSNHWDQTSGGKHGTIMLFYSANNSVTCVAQRDITANTSKAAGGTSTLTLDAALPHTLFDSYSITGRANSASAVWRTYGLPSWAGPHVAKQSTKAFAFHLSSGLGETLTSSPMGVVMYSSNGLPPYNEVAVGISVDPDAGTVTFGQPTYQTAGNRAPDVVRAIVPIYTGANTVTVPADVGGSPTYTGTGADYVERTLTVTLRDWRDPRDAADVEDYAWDILDSVKDVAMEGTISYLGLFEDALEPGLTFNVTGSDYETSWEDAELANVMTEVLWNVNGANILTVMHASNRRAHLSEGAFMHPERAGIAGDGGASLEIKPLDFGPGFGSDLLGSIGARFLDASAEAVAGSLAGSIDPAAVARDYGQAGRNVADIAFSDVPNVLDLLRA